MVGRRSTAGLRKRVQTLATQGDDSMFELAEALSDLRAIPKPDRPSFDDLVDLTKLSRRTIFYLLKVWGMVGGLGLPRDRLVGVGWTKLAVIAETCEPHAVQEALDLADTCTAKELPALLKGDAPNRKARTVLLRLTPLQYGRFETVLLANGARQSRGGRGLSGKEKALMKALGQ